MTNKQLQLIKIFDSRDKMLIYDYISFKSSENKQPIISYKEFVTNLTISLNTVQKLIKEMEADQIIFSKTFRDTVESKKHKAYWLNSEKVDALLTEQGYNEADDFKVDEEDDGSFEHLIEATKHQEEIERQSRELHSKLSEANNKLFATYLKAFEKSFGDYSEEDWMYWMGCLNNCKNQAHIQYVLQAALNSGFEPTYLSYRDMPSDKYGK